MDAEVAKYLAVGLAMSIGLLGPSLGEGMMASKAMEAIGRNPEAAGKINSLILILMAICESIAIYALVISLILIFT